MSDSLASQEGQSSRIFVGNVAPDTDPDLIEQQFKSHGNVTGVAVHKGYCFVQYENPQNANQAIEKENGAMFLGKRIDVKTAKRGPPKENPNPPRQEERPQRQEEEPPQHKSQPQRTEDQRDKDYKRPYNYDDHDDGNYRGRGRGGDRGRGRASDRGGYNDDYDDGNYRGRGRGRGGDRGRGRGGDYNDRGRGGGYNDRGRGGGYNDRGRGGGGYNDFPPRGRGRGGGRGGYSDYHDDGYGYHEPQGPPQDTHVEPAAPPNKPPGKSNDCEIVCVSRQQRQYAERIEARLKVIGLKVDVLFPNPKVDLQKIMSNIASRGVMFAILVTPLNDDHNSVTLNILQGELQEHRNMPLEDAINLIAKLFERGLNQPDNKDLLGNNDSSNRRGGMPEDVRNVFGFLMDARPLSVMEYDKLIKYLAKQRENMLISEYGEYDNIPANLITPPIGPPLDSTTKAKQEELQTKIIEILSKKKMNNINLNEANVNKSSNPAGGGGAPELSASLQKAIDSLIKTGPNLLSGGSGAGPQTPASSATSASDYFSAYGNRGGRGGY